MKPKLLIVEDDTGIRKSLQSLLSERYEISDVADGIAAIKAAITDPPDLVLMDIMLPNLDGFQVCEALRQDVRTQAVPIIMVSALRSTAERIRAFQAGADDYLSKPFDIEELIARIDSKLNRFQPLKKSDRILRCGNLTMNLDSLEIWVADQQVRFSQLEFRLLSYLIEHKGKLCSREQILKEVWESSETSGRILDPHILSIRKKLKGFNHVITSVYGGGYILKPTNQPAVNSDLSK